MIEFKFSKNELNELKSTVPNFEVILEALKDNPSIELVIDDNDERVESITSSH